MQPTVDLWESSRGCYSPDSLQKAAAWASREAVKRATDNSRLGSSEISRMVFGRRPSPASLASISRIGRSASILSAQQRGYVFFQMAEVAVPKHVFRAILDRIQRLRLPETVPG